MFNKITFKNNNENNSFQKYKLVRGEYLYKQIYDIMLDIKDKNDIAYSDFSSVIRYDKSLRDNLYIYLSTFEEYLKANIFRKYDISDNLKIDSKDANAIIENAIKKETNDYSNLYYNFDLDLYGIIKFIENHPLDLQIDTNKLNNVRCLRNDIMHHRLITCGKAKTQGEVKNNLVNLKNQITYLRDLLPVEYQNDFTKTINNMKCDVDFFKIILE